MTETLTNTAAVPISKQMRAIKNLTREFSFLDENTIAEIWKWLAEEVSKGKITTIEKLMEEAFNMAYDINAFDRAKAEDGGERINWNDVKHEYGL
ncbi:MAG: hypothetical protein LBN97_03905 [Oscillospiraceae bacterium]|jgi:cation transport regulator ChaB|nr:hypothetical protein [Oscillospiraceae bacterium]